jgi:hypothetical protein
MRAIMGPQHHGFVAGGQPFVVADGAPPPLLWSG